MGNSNNKELKNCNKFMDVLVKSLIKKEKISYYYEEDFDHNKCKNVLSLIKSIENNGYTIKNK